MVKKLLDKYKAIPITVKASFWFLICGFVQRGISLITTPIFSRLLSTSEYGDFSVYQTWYNIIIIFASLNLASGVYMRGLVKYEEDQDRFTGSLQCLYMLTTAICFGIYMLFQNRWDKFFGLDSSFIYAMFIDILAATAYQFWSTRQRVDFKYRNLGAYFVWYFHYMPVGNDAALPATQRFTRNLLIVLTTFTISKRK